MTHTRRLGAVRFYAFCLVLALIFLGLTAWRIWLVNRRWQDKILPNVYCAGVDLGGMTVEEAERAVEEALRDSVYSVRVVLPDCAYTFRPAQQCIMQNGATVAQTAYAYGRAEQGPFGLYRSYRRAKAADFRIGAETVLTYSRADIEALAGRVSRETYLAPTAPRAICDPETHRVTVSLGKPGRIVEARTVTDTVCRAFDRLSFEDIALNYEKVEADLADLRQVCRRAAYDFHVLPIHPRAEANPATHAIDLTMGTAGWRLDGSALFDLGRQAMEDGRCGAVSLAMEPIPPRAVDLTQATQMLSCEPTEPFYASGAVQEGTLGYALDWRYAADLLANIRYGQRISIPMTPVRPKRTAEELRAVLFRDELAAFRTDHTANASRTNNLDLACQAIDGTVLNAGETFSFNDVVGERTADKGYRPATVYVGSESREQLGGGICQVASTLYDAALYAEMEITQRACHTFFVTYVPGGLDATVYWGSLDFGFRNSTEYPVRIRSWVSGGAVHVAIDGTKDNDHVVELSSTRLSTVPYGTVYVEDSSKPAGYSAETTHPYTGYSYEAYQYVYDGDGVLLEANDLGRSTYSKRDRVVTVGTG